MVKKNPAEAGARLRWGWESGDPLGSPPERPEVLAERRRRPRPALVMSAHRSTPISRKELGELPGMTLSCRSFFCAKFQR